MREPKSAGGNQDLGPSVRLRPPARLKKRADFVRAAKGAKAHGRAFSLQALRRKGEFAQAPPRFGFTVTKKTGVAVVRNRIRRRLKEALRGFAHLSARPGYDYVILGRQAALKQEFGALQEELARALAEVHGEAGPPRTRASRAAKPRRHVISSASSDKKD